MGHPGARQIRPLYETKLVKVAVRMPTMGFWDIPAQLPYWSEEK